MQLSTHRAMLFGGTLFAAGIVSVGQAQWSLVPSGGVQNYTFLRIISDDEFLPLVSYNSGEGFHDAVFDLDSYNDTYVGGSVRSYLQPYSMGTYLNLTPGSSGVPGMGYAYTLLKARVTVAEDVQVLAEWDFTQITGAAIEEFNVFSTAAGDLVFDIDDKGDSGSAVFLMEAGDTYSVRVRLLDAFTPSVGWTRLTIIPAPGAIALLGMAGIINARRRRSES